MTCGIYKLTQTQTGKFYIGSSVNIGRRLGEHRRDLARNKHCNPHLQKSYNKHGLLEASVILVCSEEDTFKEEQRLIDELKPELNMSPVAALGAILAHESRTEKGRLIRKERALRLLAEGRLGGTPEEMGRRGRLKSDEVRKAQSDRATAYNNSLTPEERSANAKKARQAQLRIAAIKRETA